MPDQATFDFTSPKLCGRAYWDAVRELRRHGSLVWVESLGGFWAATSYELVLRIAQDWETFSSGEGVALNRPEPDVLPYIMPIDVDPPVQRAYRKQLNPHFVPKVLRPLEGAIREAADELIDSFVDDGRCDIAGDFARKFPGTVFFRLIVHCSDEDFRRVEPTARIVTFEHDDQERFAQAAADFRAWASDVLETRRGEPRRHDAVDAVLHLRDTGETFADHELLSGLHILAEGGIGTSASVIGATMTVLAEDPVLQDRVRQDRSLVPSLVEECMRLEPPVALMFRTATRDVDVADRSIHKGDKIGLMFGAANRDPAVFDDPEEVRLDRDHNRHLAFGAGTHRCIGSNLARLQIRVAVDRLLERLGPFRIPDGAEVTYMSSQARGPVSVPLEFELAG